MDGSAYDVQLFARFDKARASVKSLHIKHCYAQNDSLYPKYSLDTLHSRLHAYAALHGDLMVEAEPEKRATRRFALRLPVAVTYSDNGSQEKSAQTRDVSARGICFYVDSAIAPGSVIEFTLTLPPEITLTESIRVRCKGKVVRVDDGDGKVAVAAVIDEYEFLAEP